MPWSRRDEALERSAEAPTDAPLLVVLPDAGDAEEAGWDETVDAVRRRLRVARWLPAGGMGRDPAATAAALALSLADAAGAGQSDSVYLCGHGWGGVAALAFAVAYPERLHGLILVDTTPEPLQASGWPARELDDAVAEGSQEEPESPGYLDRLEFIITPTLVIAGEADAPFWQRGAELLHGWMPFSRLVRIPGSAHAPQRENPAAFCAELLAFLDEMEASLAAPGDAG